MEFAVLFCVFTIILTKVIAKPTDVIKKDGNTNGADISDQLQFKLPQALKHNFKIVVNGSLDPLEKTFTAVLPNIREDGHCTINYDHSKTKVEVSPPVEGVINTEEFEIFYSDSKNFSLELMAMENGDVKMMEMMLIVPGSGNVGPLLCFIKDFEELGSIYFKDGVKNISSILFTF